MTVAKENETIGTKWDQWQPIDTAPDDVPVLVCGSKRLLGPAVAHKAEGEWLIETCSSFESIYPPAFWMQLPSLPLEVLR